MIYSLREGNPKKGWVVIVHGLGEHSGRYRKMVEDFVNMEYGVVTFDHPGHGRSDGKRGDTTIEEILSIIDDVTFGIPKFHIFGHSLGGLIAVRYTQERQERIKSLVVSAPALGIRVDPLTNIMARSIGRLFPHVTVNNKLDPEYLSRNKEVIKKVASDPLMHSKISFRLGLSMIENIRIAHEKAKDMKVPTLILVPTDDRYVDPNGAREFFKKLTVVDKSLIEFPGGYHELFEDEEYKDKFYNTIYDWIEKHN